MTKCSKFSVQRTSPKTSSVDQTSNDDILMTSRNITNGESQRIQKIQKISYSSLQLEIQTADDLSTSALPVVLIALYMTEDETSGQPHYSQTFN